MPFDYPSARKGSLVETIHGIKIADPYRWMEDVDSEETKRFVQEQQALTDAYLKGEERLTKRTFSLNIFEFKRLTRFCFKDAPNREDIRRSLKEIWNYEKFTCPFKAGESYYYFGNSDERNQDVMYSVRDLDDAQPTVFLDPNELSKEGTSALNEYAFSDDAKWFAYTIADGGSDWLRMKIRNVQTKEDLPEELSFCLFTKIAWTPDSAGFFYSGFEDPSNPEATKHHKIFYHRIGTPQSEDFIAIEFPDQPKALLLGRMNNRGDIMHIQLNEECRDVKWSVWLSEVILKSLRNRPISSAFSDFD